MLSNNLISKLQGKDQEAATKKPNNPPENYKKSDTDKE